jgi:KDO2-lipid IV(A) lauroyltransferase
VAGEGAPPSRRSSGDVSKSRLLARAEWLAAAPIIAAARVVSHERALALGRRLGLLHHRLSPSDRAVARASLRIAFAGTLTGAETDDAVRGAFVNLGQTLVEFFWLSRASRDTVLGKTDFAGLEHLDAARASGGGAIVCAAHLSSWYWPAIALAARGEPVTVVMRPLDNPLLDARMTRVLRDKGVEPVPRPRSVAPALAALRRGGILGLLVDQNAAVGGAFVPFLGTLASTMRGPAVLRRRTGAPIVCAHDARDGVRHRVTFARLEGLPADDEGCLARINEHFDGIIRARRRAYLWTHPRWKRRPPGTPDLYPGLRV